MLSLLNRFILRKKRGRRGGYECNAKVNNFTPKDKRHFYTLLHGKEIIEENAKNTR